jgi:hypothetical protein
VNPDRPVAFEILAILFVVLVGLFVRGRWRLSFFFPAYVANALGLTLLIAIWPERFYTRASWLVAQTVVDTLKLGLVLEAAWWTFRVFPGAQSAARKVLVAVLVTTALSVTAVPTAINGWDSYETALGQIHPVVNNGAIWLIVVTLATALWYRVPVHPFHAAVLTSFALYLAVLGALIRLAVLHGFDQLRVYVGVLDQAAFTLLACWWAYIVWRPETPAARVWAETLGKLQFRASSWA